MSVNKTKHLKFQNVDHSDVVISYPDGVIFSGEVEIQGDLHVTGNTTSLSSIVESEDINIVLNKITTPSDTTANGGGISLLGSTNKTFTWNDSTDCWTSNQDFDLVATKAYKINNDLIMNATTIGSNVVTSSLTSVGTLNGLSTATGAVNITTTGLLALESTNNAATAIWLHADGGIAESIEIYADQGTNVASINLVSDAGGITLTASKPVAITNNATIGGSLSLTGALITIPDTVTNAAAVISTSTSATLIDATNAGALTIGAGVNGQIKFLSCIAGTGNMTISNTYVNVGTQLLFNAVGEAATLIFDDTSNKWSICGVYGATPS